ncbi:DUF6133 family protein [Chakrabartyella piscis]|uniref:DUF6133 family protein n=1 Tax=Chakrabartyella piscis TaxID=2918914 RepID=UPI00295861EB|nr:DUF6133 family protein [Chakrabartyella piscis]
MKKLFNKMNDTANAVAMKAVIFKERSKEVLSNNRGEGTVSQAITILISVVLGALLLAGLYLLFDEVVLPTLTERIQEMFDYQG